MIRVKLPRFEEIFKKFSTFFTFFNLKRRIQIKKTRLDEWLENVPKHVKEMRRALKKMGAKIEKAFSPKFRELAQKIEAIEKEDSDGQA